MALRIENHLRSMKEDLSSLYPDTSILFMTKCNITKLLGNHKASMTKVPFERLNWMRKKLMYGKTIEDFRILKIGNQHPIPTEIYFPWIGFNDLMVMGVFL